MDETIAAISTPVGDGGIAIIRVSGATALAVADGIFCCKRGQPSRFATHTLHFGTIRARARIGPACPRSDRGSAVAKPMADRSARRSPELPSPGSVGVEPDPPSGELVGVEPDPPAGGTAYTPSAARNGEIIDQVMLAVMRAPRSYTGENVVEIHCHGGLLTARKILALCLESGAHLAEPGEFTKRAFLNGRLDLTQAEAVMDLIHSRTDRAHAAAVHALEGHLSTKVNALRDQLVTILAHLEAQLDFPEEDLAPATREKLLGQIEAVSHDLDALLRTAREGRILREGISVAIVGRPNVGKSSLMNALLGQDRAIVTPIPGTTRDTIEECANIAGILFRLTDTAGIRKPRGQVEQLGVQRSRASVARSDVILHVLDSSRPYTEADDDIASQHAGKHAILVLNKSDLRRQLTIPETLGRSTQVDVSAITHEGIDLLKQRMSELALGGRVGTSDLDVAINERHATALRTAQKRLTDVLLESRHGAALEVIAQQIRTALDALGEIVGKTTTDDILTKIFSTFCIGK